MNIGIIGNGHMAEALGGGWTAAGHAVRFGGRSPDKVQGLAGRVGRGATAGTIPDAAAFGEVVVLAVDNRAAFDALAAAGDLTGKVLIDINNPVDIKTFRMTTPPGTSLAEQLAEKAPAARVVKAFNMSQAGVWKAGATAANGRPLGVPHCGDDPAAKEAVARLIADLGCTPVDVGPLARARLLEPAAALVISQIFERNNPGVVFDLIVPA